jgi:hypothetical protein
MLLEGIRLRQAVVEGKELEGRLAVPTVQVGNVSQLERGLHEPGMGRSSG